MLMTDHSDGDYCLYQPGVHMTHLTLCTVYIMIHLYLYRYIILYPRCCVDLLPNFYLILPDIPSFLSSSGVDERGRRVCLDKRRRSPGKGPEMDVVFGPRPDKCYSKPAKKKKLHLSQEVPALLPVIESIIVTVSSGETPSMQQRWSGMLCCGHHCVSDPRPNQSYKPLLH